MKQLLAALALCLSLGTPAHAAEPVKTLRYAFRVAETGFDPPRISDIYSRTVTAHIFETLYAFDPLARPTRLVPLIAAGEPEVSADFKTFAIKVRPGIYFADDPAFKGRKREVTAADFVYSIKRFADPANNAQGWVNYEDQAIVGLDELREQIIKSKKPFPYDTEIEGVKALDRYTLQIKTSAPPSSPRRIHLCRQRHLRRRRARSRRVLWRPHHGAPGRNRSLRAQGMAPQLADRVRAQPGLPRTPLRSPARPG